MNDIQVMEQTNRVRDPGINYRSSGPGSQIVKVYAFEAYDPLHDRAVLAPCKMTVADIESWRGVPIDGTEEEVPANKLDDNGRYYPRG